MSVPSIDWFTESVQECTTQRQYMRHRFLRTVQKQSPWLALASIFTILFGLPLIPLQANFEFSLLQSLGSFVFTVISLRVIYDNWRWLRMTRLLTGAVLLWFFVQVYWLLSSPLSYSHVLSAENLLLDANHGQVATDFIMSFLVMLGYLLCHFRYNRTSQTILCVAILMPVTGLLAQAYQIPDAYGQLSLLFSVAGVLCAMSLLAKQVSQTPMSYLLLLDDTGQHLRWIVAVLFFFCARLHWAVWGCCLAMIHA